MFNTIKFFEYCLSNRNSYPIRVGVSMALCDLCVLGDEGLGWEGESLWNYNLHRYFAYLTFSHTVAKIMLCPFSSLTSACNFLFM